MTKSVMHGKILILSKGEINEMFVNEKEDGYKIVQIEHGFNDDYIVEVVEKCSGITMVPISDLDSVIKKWKTISYASSVGDKE